MNVFKNGPITASFSAFQHVTIQIKNDKSVDFALGIQIRGSGIEGADKSTELWWQP